MDAFVGGVVVLVILGACAAIPFWLFKQIRRPSRVDNPASLSSPVPPPIPLPKPQKLTYNERIQEAKAELTIGENAAAVAAIDPGEIGYRPVGDENVVAIQNSVDRLELKSTGRYHAKGLSFSIPIVRGVRYRVGGGSIKTEKTLQVTGRGRLIATDKAIVFESPEKNERITWGQIADIEFFTDGYQVAKRSGPPRTFSIKDPDPRFAAVLDILLSRV